MKHRPEITGQLELGGSMYAWRFHPHRLRPDWREQRASGSGWWLPPGWSFELVSSLSDGLERPVHCAAKVWKAWQTARLHPAVREAIAQRSGAPDSRGTTGAA